MVIFAIIMFALAGVRTLSKIVEVTENVGKFTASGFLSSVIVAVTYWIAFIWFLNQFVTLK